MHVYLPDFAPLHEAFKLAHGPKPPATRTVLVIHDQHAHYSECQAEDLLTYFPGNSRPGNQPDTGTS